MEERLLTESEEEEINEINYEEDLVECETVGSYLTEQEGNYESGI